MDVEERNALSRTTAREATVVLAVGTPGLKGLHSLGRLIRELCKLGVKAEGIVPVVNHAPRLGLERAHITKTLRALTDDLNVTNPVVFLPHTELDGALTDGALLSKRIVTPLTTTVTTVIDRAGLGVPELDTPIAVVPGSLGLFDEASGRSP